MKLDDWICCQGEDRDRLLLDARRIAAKLPAPTPGSLVALAFGRDRRALAVGIVACWLRGHGAAVVENAHRERIQQVLAHPAVISLMHDTDSGRALQLPRALAAADAAPDHEQHPLTLTAAPLPTPMLAVHVQTDDGDQTWCTWSPEELLAALKHTPANPRRAATLACPGMLSSLFVDTLGWLRGAAPMTQRARRPIGFVVPGAPSTATQRLQERDQLLAMAGIEDVAFLNRPDGVALTALAGPGAAAVARAMPNARAMDKIPRDVNGQPVRPDLFLRFGLGRRGQAVTRELLWRELHRDRDEVSLQTTIPTNYLFYEGHFDDYPVLAGGVQLHELVMPQLRALLDAAPALEQLDGVKFLARFVPGETIELALRRADDGRKLTFEIRRG
ncbi:MAG: hypothetical protein VXY92_03230, partial [Planctomycetota bacterium]|nr:hypothetical protein [Planctomycetota bacterium]